MILRRYYLMMKRYFCVGKDALLKMENHIFYIMVIRVIVIYIKGGTFDMNGEIIHIIILL